MNDKTDDQIGAPDETPIQRALRLKQASLKARAPVAGGKRYPNERTAAAHSAAKSKPKS